MGAKVVRGLPASDSAYELLIDSGKNVLDRWNFSGKFYGDPTKQEETNAVKKTLNIQTPNGESFRNWMEWEGSVPAKDSRLTPVTVIESHPDNVYVVQRENKNALTVKPTFAKFKDGQKAWIDQWENLYTGNKGGMPYGNPNERIPAYIEIKDSGTVELIEETDLFSSFKFNGKLLKGYYIMRRESPDSPIWIFSKGKLPGEKIKEDLYNFDSTAMPEFIDFSDTSLPVEIKFKNSNYNLILTENDKLILNKK